MTDEVCCRSLRWEKEGIHYGCYFSLILKEWWTVTFFWYYESGNWFTDAPCVQNETTHLLCTLPCPFSTSSFLPSLTHYINFETGQTTCWQQYVLPYETLIWFFTFSLISHLPASCLAEFLSVSAQYSNPSGIWFGVFFLYSSLE